jgi:hypothetical protein
VSRQIPEHKLVDMINKTVSDRLFNHPNFGWQMRNTHPIIQREFFEAVWAFIETMADMEGKETMYAYDKDTADLCSVIRDSYKEKLAEGL